MWERKREGGREREREGERERESERERDVPSLSVGPDLAPTFKHPFMLAPRLSAIETTCFICWSLCEQPERSCDAARHTHTHTYGLAHGFSIRVQTGSNSRKQVQ